MGKEAKDKAVGLLRRAWHNYVVRNVVLAISLLVIILFVANVLLNIFTRHNKHVAVPDITGLTMTEASAAAGKDDLRIEVNDSLYVSTLEPGVILEQQPSAGTEVKPGRRIYVTVNASQQKIVDVPYVTGYSLRQAKNLLETAGFTIERLVYVDDIATNNVLEESVNGRLVAAENSVRAPMGSGVVLTLGRSDNASPVPVPRVTGLTLRDASSRIWESGLNVGHVSFDEGMDRMDMRYARVASQTPDQGRRLGLGSTISLRLTLDSLRIANGMESSKRHGARIAQREQALRDSLAAAGYSGERLQEEFDWIFRIENGETRPAEAHADTVNNEEFILRSLEDYGSEISRGDESEFFE